ncbi:MAG TPA: 4-(cytidine 5'-diphospho)-2-C-methyl-D-erythritol kinase [Thermodesulfobacteriota bacterium]|nr:4-(cytidine 5'-diphospho)-2-C-methyl-D-erythritol kinase [Thermodesulfobacteriota bacterium]
MKSITLLSPAKINLTLEILGKRPDGYHEIRSIIQPVNLFDEMTIELEEGEGIEIKSTGFDVPLGERNLAWKAAHIFINEIGLKLKVRISIKKRIPVGAGLGGGSGNASAVLVGMNRLTGSLSKDELITLSPRIGADVAFFIHCRSGVVQGIGERVTLIRDFPLFYYVLINPGFQVPTNRVYELWDEVGREDITHVGLEETLSLFKRGMFPLRNDLERAATILYPEIMDLKERLISMGAQAVSMTGSGPTVFGVFRDWKKARMIYDYMKDSDTLKVFFVQGISGWHRLV